MPSVKELFFTVGVVNSFTLRMVGPSVDLSQLGRIQKLHHSDWAVSSVSLVQPKKRLGPHQNLGFGSVFIENRSFGFSFKTDPALHWCNILCCMCTFTL